MDDNVALPDHEIKYEVGPAGDVETKRESAPKAIARRSPVAIALGLLIVALLGYATYRIMWPQEQGRRQSGRGFSRRRATGRGRDRRARRHQDRPQRARRRDAHRQCNH